MKAPHFITIVSWKAASLGLLTCLSLAATPVSTQEPTKIWLPIRHAEELRDELEAIIEHATTRDVCTRVIEARLHDASNEDDPKFIITCRSADYGTQNLVYWQHDVEDGFADVAYAEILPSQVEEETVYLFTEEEKSMLLDRCKTALSDSLEGQHQAIPAEAIRIQERHADQLAIFIEFHRSDIDTATPYLATCLSRADRSVRLAIFPL